MEGVEEGAGWGISGGICWGSWFLLARFFRSPVAATRDVVEPLPKSRVLCDIIDGVNDVDGVDVVDMARSAKTLRSDIDLVDENVAIHESFAHMHHLLS